jgi:twitching motility protein PilT
LTLHSDICAQISQREIGRDTANWLSGIQGALSLDVDVLVVSEQPDLAARRLLVRAAEEGCCVVAAVPAATPEFALDAFLEGFEGEARARLSARLNAVLLKSVSLGPKGSIARLDEIQTQSCAA